MRACAISRCKRSIAILLETLYVLYAIAMFVAITKSVNHVDRECCLLEILSIDYISLAAQFENLSEISVCFSPVPGMLLILSYHLDLIPRLVANSVSFISSLWKLRVNATSDTSVDVLVYTVSVS